MDLANLILNSVYAYVLIVLPVNLENRQYKYFQWFPRWTNVFTMNVVTILFQLAAAITIFVRRKEIGENTQYSIMQGVTSVICLYQGFLFSMFEDYYKT